MSEHLDTHGLERFIAHKLPPDELLRAARHIGVCQPCRERIARAQSTGARIESLRAELRRETKSVEQHLDYERLEAYVDDTLGAVERETARNHLAVCPPCAREAQELATLREDLAHASNAAASLPSERPWQRLRDSFKLSPRIVWAAAALLIVAAAAGLLLWQRGRAPEVANDNSSNASEVVNDNSGNTPGGVNGNRNLPEVVNDSGVNDNASGSAGGSTTRDPYEAVVKHALETQRIDRAPVLKELAGRPSTLMSGGQSVDLASGPGGAAFALLRPVGTATSSNRPTFHWQPLAGATSYQVYVLDTDFKVVAESGPVTATSWSPPTALKRGVVYLWQVSAAKDGAVITAPGAAAPEARFKILTASKARAVQRAVMRRDGSPLARGIIYAHTGLLDDAEREFRTALNRNQGAGTARKLLRNVSTVRR
jgi:hypothetical protein